MVEATLFDTITLTAVPLLVTANPYALPPRVCTVPGLRFTSRPPSVGSVGFAHVNWTNAGVAPSGDVKPPPYPPIGMAKTIPLDVEIEVVTLAPPPVLGSTAYAGMRMDPV
jgi:hypothetical protein